MTLEEIYLLAEPGDTFRCEEWPRTWRDWYIDSDNNLVLPDREIGVKWLRSGKWIWVRRHNRCPKCNQRLPEGWEAPKREMTIVEIAEKWQEGDEFTNPERRRQRVRDLTFREGFHGGAAPGWFTDNTIIPFNCKTFTLEDIRRHDWYFTNRCPECGQRIGEGYGYVTART